MEIIVGTAGHIDHGKTSLVLALTGIDADRLPEEKRRGITVDLGFAEMSIGDAHFGFVDVPGHERFVKNMLAGASGIDLVILTIAADEGVMPQTREHFDICRLLGIRAGVVVLTKSDLVDHETLELARIEAAELFAGSFLENAPTIAVSSRTGSGLDELKTAITNISARLPGRGDQSIARLPIDRSFTVKGFGAVATGTLVAGEIAEGAEMELLPGGARVRVRGLQTHGQIVKTARTGQRVAVNLGGIDHSKVTRGMVLAETGVLRPTQIIDAEIELLKGAAKPLRSRQRVRVHLGTVEALARVYVLNSDGAIEPGEKDVVQLRLETAVAAVAFERFIIRSYSPQTTVAGGRVIDTFAAKHRRKDLGEVRAFLDAVVLAEGDTAALIVVYVDAAGAAGLDLADLRERTAIKPDLLTAAINAAVAGGAVVAAGSRYISQTVFDDLARSVEKAIAEFHRREPLAKGVSREAIRERVFAHLPPDIPQAVIASLETGGKIIADRETIRLAGYETTLSPTDAAVSKKLFVLYRAAGLEVPKLEEALTAAVEGTGITREAAMKLFRLFLDSGEIVKVNDEFYFTHQAIDGLIDLVRRYAARSSDRLIDVPTFKEMAGLSRKYAIPLLEYLDREHITSRAGDKRLIR